MNRSASSAATAYRPGTQTDRVLRRLMFGWTCGTTFLNPDSGVPIPRYSSRIAELRADSWHVERRRCESTLHRHKTMQYEWRVSAKPPEDGQLFGGGL